MIRKISKLYIIAAMLLCGTFTSMAQSNPLDRAEALISSKEYSAALEELNKISSISVGENEIADYLRVVCNIHINATRATVVVDEFLKSYPASTRKVDLVISEADALWQKNDFANARKYYIMTDKFSIKDPQLRNTFSYRKAYCAYATGDYQIARAGMYSLLDDKVYGQDACYIYGHICYTQGDMGIAQQSFEKIQDSPKYAEKAGIYLTNIYFARKDYPKTISSAEKVLKNTKNTNEDIVGVKKTLARAYFNSENYTKAIPLFKESFASTVPTAEEEYLLGYAYYRCGQNAQAESSLSSLTEKNDIYAQKSLFILGDIYLKSGKKNLAFDAFKKASAMDFDPSVKQNAWYNYALLSYEIGNPYTSVSSVIREYLSLYPESPYATQMYDYLIDSFISAKEYEEAISCIESMRLDSPKAKQAHQMACFYLAGQKLTDRDYDAALKYYTKTAEINFDPTTTARAHFWAGETYTRMGMNSKAEEEFTVFSTYPANTNTDEHKRLNYQLGYLSATKGDYSSALNYFSQYSKNNLSNDEIADVNMRLADCYFALGQYSKAQSLYSKAATGAYVPKDYLSYQNALCMGIQGQYKEQINALTRFLNTYTQSSLRGVARYDLGVAYQKTNQNAKALEAFTAVEKEKNTGDIVPQAMTKAALVLYNDGKTDQALSMYQKVVEKYPSAEVTPVAMRWARQIFVENGKSDEFITWNNSIGATPIDQLSLDSLHYETAEKHFSKEEYTQAITSYDEYLKRYPSGLFTPDALYHRAQSYIFIKDTAKAKEDYKTLADTDAGKYTENSLVKYIDLMSKTDQMYQALPYLEKLYQTATSEDNKKYALVNILSVYDNEQDWDNVIKYADIVRNDYKKDLALYADASTAMYVALVENEQYDKAKKMTSAVKKIAADQNMARVLYYEAQILYMDQKYDASIENITKLSTSYPMYKYIGARALLLLAKDFHAKNDEYQANYIIDNVISNTTYDDVLAEAKALKEYINSKK
ncbi:MAG: tetratricopeptide repeat protein [Flavobacteriales bacterium]|nr:tetratricopeptide repeat protein [Flavobacteriales bacterium]